MAEGSWVVEPLPVAQFALGEGPFRVRGLDPYAPYFDQLFVVGGDYDLSPLARLFQVAARVRGLPVTDFIERRSRASAKADVHGMWKPLFNKSTPQGMAERLNVAFNRYFQPCEARNISVAPDRFEAELLKLPAPMAGVHVASTRGFVQAALEVAGAKDLRIEMGKPAPDGNLKGVALVRTSFVLRWSV